MPSPDPTVTGYEVYVRDAGAPHANDAAWSGNPAREANGAMSALVTFTPSAAGANYFAVVAVQDGAESPLSLELPTGTPVACHADRCETKSSCDFGELPDGTACDAVTDDPCLAACQAGECGTSTDGSSAEVELNRLRFRSRAAGVVLSIKGRFTGDDALDPASTGAVMELRAADGRTLHVTTIDAASFTSSGSGGRFHFAAAAAGADADPAWHGLQRLDFRRRASRWIVVAQFETPELAAAALEPSLTLILRVGTTCARRLDAACTQKATRSVCR